MTMEMFTIDLYQTDKTGENEKETKYEQGKLPINQQETCVGNRELLRKRLVGVISKGDMGDDLLVASATKLICQSIDDDTAIVTFIDEPMNLEIAKTTLDSKRNLIILTDPNRKRDGIEKIIGRLHSWDNTLLFTHGKKDKEIALVDLCSVIVVIKDEEGPCGYFATAVDAIHHEDNKQVYVPFLKNRESEEPTRALLVAGAKYWRKIDGRVVF